MFLNVKDTSSDCSAKSYSTFKKSKLEISGEGGGGTRNLRCILLVRFIQERSYVTLRNRPHFTPQKNLEHR